MRQEEKKKKRRENHKMFGSPHLRWWCEKWHPRSKRGANQKKMIKFIGQTTIVLCVEHLMGIKMPSDIFYTFFGRVQYLPFATENSKTRPTHHSSVGMRNENQMNQKPFQWIAFHFQPSDQGTCFVYRCKLFSHLKLEIWYGALNKYLHKNHEKMTFGWSSTDFSTVTTINTSTPLV